ncbi:nitric oxide reductase [bacterium BMS3Abin01]|nr:nitric oxide reductase [bacterium BMS3Abin01]HDZ59509.1 FprA family A-type flavoprotein [Actinomycetota bacterium]
MKATEIKPDIFWVGAVDWSIRDFHGYVIPHGSTYNNYLIIDEEITLVDSVKSDFAETGIRNITNIIDPARIDNIVINHIENDHVGALDRMVDLAPDATIYITERGKLGLGRFFNISGWDIRTVKTGDELHTGKYTLRFLETPMLHWPDSMMTYIPQARLLISQDAFGQHLATTARFDDEFIECASHPELEDAVVDYYANILMPFGKLITNKIADIQELKLDIDMIAPDHGVIWRANPDRVMEMYLEMAAGKADLSVAIIYDTMWKSTEIMTQPMVQGIKDEGVEAKVIKLRATPMSVAIKEFWKSRGCLVGSPTLNNEVFPSVAEFMTHLRGLRPKDRLAGAFGSYGWSGGATKWLYGEFERMKLDTAGPGIQVQYRPSPEDMDECYQFGRKFAGEVKEYHQNYQKG